MQSLFSLVCVACPRMHEVKGGGVVMVVVVVVVVVENSFPACTSLRNLCRSSPSNKFALGGQGTVHSGSAS